MSDSCPFFETASDLLLVADRRGQMIRANAAFRRTLGYASTELADVSCADIFLAPHWEEIASATEAELPGVRLRAKDGRQLELTGQRGDGDDGEVWVLFYPPLAAALLELMEHESNRIAAAIHDGFVQHAVGASMWIESVKDDLRADQAAALEAADTVAECVRSAVAEARQVIAQLRPLISEHADFGAGLAGLVGELQRQTNAHIEVAGEISQLPGPLATTAIRILREALRNAVQHSGSEKISVRLEQQPDWLLLSVADDGLGFDVQDAWSRAKGMHAMRERAAALGGTLEIVSHPGGGTRVTCQLPTHLSQQLPPTENRCD